MGTKRTTPEGRRFGELWRKLVHRAQEHAGITQSAMARRIGVSRDGIQAPMRKSGQIKMSVVLKALDLAGLGEGDDDFYEILNEWCLEKAAGDNKRMAAWFGVVYQTVRVNLQSHQVANMVKLAVDAQIEYELEREGISR